MSETIAMIGAGAMGTAVAKRLVFNGCKVVTALEGRSADSLERAREAGVTPASANELAQARIVLSIVPPNAAEAAADAIAPILGKAETPPLFVDLNAIHPQRARAIAEKLEVHGVPYADGGIIGGVPRPEYAGPSFFVSGKRAGEVLFLKEFGLNVIVMEGAVGAASALKMSYGAITKGHIALGAAMILAADRAGVRDDLIAELGSSQKAFLEGYRRSIPDMFSKAHRWVPEMEEIVTFIGLDRAEAAIWQAVAGFYRQMADDYSGDKSDISKLAEALEPKA